MCKRSLLFLSLYAVFSSAASAEPLSGDDMKALLAKIREKRASAPQVQADFQEEKTLRMMNKPVVASGKVWFQAPNKFRREVKGNAPSLTVSDGNQLWIYYPKFQSVEKYALGKRSALDAGIAALTASLNLEGVEQTYAMSGSREAGGHKIELAPRGASLKRVLQRFVIHFNEALQVERTEMVQPNGDRITTIYSNESRAPISAELFEFAPPPGTKITTPLG